MSTVNDSHSEESVSEVEKKQGEKTEPESVEESATEQRKEENPKKDLPAETKEEEEILTVTCQISDFPIDRRFGDLALQNEVILALQEKGYLAATRYQQAILHHLLLGKDWWVNARFSSNRAVAFGAYFADVASCYLAETSVIICSCIPEVRRNFSNDIAEWSIFTDVAVGMLQKEIKEDVIVTLSEMPHVFIASPTNICTLVDRGLLDVSKVKVVYLDEAEKLCSEENVTAISKLLGQMEKPQVVFQTSYLSHNLLETFHKWSPELVPMCFEKASQKFQKRHLFIAEEFSLERLQSLLTADFHGRLIILCPEEAQVEEVGRGLARFGWDVDILRKASHPKQKERNERKLKDGYLQMLVCTPEVFPDLKINFPIRVISSIPFSEDRKSTAEKLVSNAQVDLLVFGGSETQVAGVEFVQVSLSSEQISSERQQQVVTQILRKTSSRVGFQSYEQLVDGLLQEPDGKELLAVALRQALQWERISTLGSEEELLRLESKDLFQRRRNNHRRDRNSRRRFHKKRS